MMLDGGNDSIDIPVLIVGAGPAGLIAAILLAHYGIDFNIVDKAAARDRVGKSETIQPRTLEILESLALREQIERVGQKVVEYAVYSRDEQHRLRRQRVGEDVTVPATYPYTITVDKGELESVLKDELRKLGRQVSMSMELLTLVKASVNSWRAKILDRVSGITQLKTAQFVLACDGANSIVRRLTEIQTLLYGSNSWAVVDVSINTDFEDIRRRCTVQSVRGNCILNPRRGGIRMRTLLDEVDNGLEEWDLSSVRFAGIDSALCSRVAAALSPVTLNSPKASWARKFKVTKHLANSFADDGLNVFLLGDAAYVTSPLTRQGINGGMMDAWNLSWKLAYVLRQKADSSILATYTAERRGLFQKAMKFDVKVEELFAFRSSLSGEFTALYDCEEASGYTSGCGCRYGANDLIQEESRTQLSLAYEILTPGKRLFPGILIRHVDGNKVNVLELLGRNYRFKLFIFLGQLMKTGLPMVYGAANYILSQGSSLLGTDIREDGSIGCNIDLFIVHTLPHLTMFIQDFPQPFPQHADNIFEDVVGRWHNEIGIRVKGGGYCLVRPDGYIAIVSNLDDCERIKKYMANLT